MADRQAKTMEDANVMRVCTKSKSVSAVSESCVNKVRQRGKAKTKKDINKFKSTEKTCFSCGGAWPHPTRRSCPAFGVECHSCGGKNHYGKLCKKGKDISHVAESEVDSDDSYDVGSVEQHFVADSSSSESDDSYKIASLKDKKKNRSHVIVNINDVPVRFQVDSGADVNVSDEKTFYEIKDKVKLTKTRAKLFPYGSKEPLPLVGKFAAAISCSGSKGYDVADFFVVKGTRKSGSLLGSASSMSLGVLKILNTVKDNTSSSPGVQQSSKACADKTQVSSSSNENKSAESLLNEYDDLFHGIGKMKDLKVKLDVDKNVRPVAQKHRRVPFHLRDKLEAELQRFEAANVIERVESATDWVSPIVIAPKTDSTDIRMCVDMVETNRAIKRIRYVIPTIDELRHDVNGAKVLSKLDLNHGFHQLELDENSRDITTFSTHVGLFRYWRLNFGTNSAPEIFHEELMKKLEGILGVRNIHDDILVTGKNVEDHNRNLKATFQRLRDSGLTLKRSKCIFSQKSIKFFGLVFSEDGISPDPEKVDALQIYVLLLTRLNYDLSYG